MKNLSLLAALTCICACVRPAYSQELNELRKVVISCNAKENAYPRLDIAVKCTDNGKVQTGITYVSYSSAGYVISILPFINIINIKQDYVAHIQEKYGKYILIRYFTKDVLNKSIEQVSTSLYTHPLTGSAGYFNMLDFIADKDFKVVSTESSGELRTIHFTSIYNNATRPAMKGIISFNKHHLVEFTYEFKAVGYDLSYRIQQKWKVVNSLDPMHGLEATVTNWCVSAGILQAVYNYTFTPSKHPPQSLNLSDYNIEIPVDDVYEDRSFNWLLWGGLGVTCLVVSALLAWIVKRRRARAG